MSRGVTAFLIAVLVPFVCVAQTPPPPAPGFPQPSRDTSAAKPTAIIRGHVFDASNGRPLRKVQVRAFSPELRENRVSITDNNGAYEIKELAAGRYQLIATKGSFVPLQYGQTRPNEQGKPLEIHDAQLLDKVDFSLPHGAIVTGRIVDENGEPAPDVQVAVVRFQYVNGRRQFLPSRSVTTNDIGEFRLFAIPPGQYYVSATLRFTNGAPNDAVSDDRAGYAPTYFPGTPNVGEAQRITLGIGQTIGDINIALSPTRLARISGAAVDSSGKPLGGGMLMVGQLSGSIVMTATGNQIRPDGTFSVGNLAPGDYVLRGQPMPTGPSAAPAAQEQFQATVTVAGEDINDLRLVGVPPSTLSGRVIPPNAQTDLRELTLLAIAKNPMPLGGNGNGRANEDGTFQFKVPPGSVYLRLNPTGAFASIRIKTVRVNGVDVTDSGLELKPNQDVSGVEVELTSQMASVTGVVTDTRGNAVRDYTVLIFPRDRERWEPTSRYLASARPDQDGRYKAQYVLPGDYYAIALDYVEQGANSDPEFLDRIKTRAIEFSINDIETRNLDLKLVTGP